MLSENACSATFDRGTHHVEIENTLENVHGMFFLEPRRAGNKAVENNNDAPQVQDTLVYRKR